MADVNITKVALLNVPLENDYKHTFYFPSATAQTTYFRTKIQHEFTDFSYQRKEGTIRIPLSYDEAIKSNYVMYKNSAFSNKTFFAFITDYEYKGEDQTNITIETDVMQTWLFDYDVKPSFIEREHVNDDTIGLHTYPENLEMGEYICNFKMYDEQPLETNIIVAVTASPKGIKTEGETYNGMFSGLKYYSVIDHSELKDLLKQYRDGKSGTTDEAIECIFIAPKFLSNRVLDVEELGDIFDPDAPLKVVASDSVKSYQIPINIDIRNNDIYGDQNGYKPKNNKLFCYPYKYLLVSNNNGGSAIYQYEHFEPTEEQQMVFEVEGVITPGGSIRIHPRNYKGVESNDEEGLNLGKYPICNWTSDVYINWLTQNSVNIGLELVSGLGQMIAGAGIALGTGGLGVAVGGGSVVGGLSQITGTIAQIHQMSMTPPQSKGNINCGDVITASNKNTFFFFGMTIKDEYLKIIDNYFDMFGYKANVVKIPHKNHRENWWYTKTIDANIDGTIPLKDLQKIKDCYNNGLTFWSNTSNFKNYSLSNAIK